ncbi:MAG TPA: MBL fold metallo-hydrolase [Pseudonocardia sp.]|jgi:glyoxylase-like metal-dependent hydrolase (beta-lactamase superfamily II)|uniref:MBL fold metallo-hydrolase n=1 Tax=Pseudonocardia sp. TaxID=60912 RepID=UPI002B4B05C7|nr:MBL fold metallo-hydrolase [Pseudonocardia sp.]HLU56355.1 MBL fold metallo-hydrolase [Pseudonocardia sp.]
MNLRRVVVGVLATNCWIVSSGGEALVVDPGDEPERVLAATAGLRVRAVVLTHTHFDHVLAVPALVDAWAVPVLAHPAEAPVWPHEVAGVRRGGHWDAGTATAALLAEDPARLAPPERLWDGAFTPVADGDDIAVGDRAVRVLHTPGHTPGGICLLAGRHLLSGDTLFPGGPGLTGPPLSDFPAIVDSVRGLLALDEATVVHPGHGPDTTVGSERPHLDEWIRRGW